MRVVRRARRADARADELRRAAALSLRGPSAEGDYAVCCPFCPARVGKEDHEHKMTIKVRGTTRPSPGREPVELSPERGVFNCYRCAARGFADFTWLAAGDLGAPPAEPPGPERDLLAEDVAEAQRHSEPLGEALRSLALRHYVDYVRRRGVLDQAIRAGARACHAGKYRGRIVLPVADAPGGPWRGFQARAIDGSAHLKYVGPRRMPRAELFYGREHLAPEGEVWVVEGPFDVLPLLGHAVAPMGKDFSPEQVDALPTWGRPLVVCLDGEAWEECRALALRFRHRGAAARWCRLPPGEDPGRMGWRVRDHVQAQ